MNIDFTTLAKGIHSGYSGSTQLLIDRPDQWADFWQQHTANIELPPPIPSVDFNAQNVVAVFAGQKPTGGYSVEIVSVETQDTKTGNSPSLLIQVKYCQPQTGQMVTEVMTQPHHLIKIPRIAGNQVTFEQV
jgi:PrcB C-terminal